MRRKGIIMEKDSLFLMRRKKKIVLREIAEHIGCSIAMLSLFENDKANLDLQKQILYKNYIMNYQA